MSMSCWSASSPLHDMHMDIEVESVSSLEREFCSNFTCCGEVHADLHALIAHHEAGPAHAHPHVRLRLRLAAAPQPPTAPTAQFRPQQLHSDVPTTTPPSPTSSSSSSSSSTCSSQPDSPITPFDSPLHNTTESRSKNPVNVLPDDLLPELEYPTYEHCYHAAIATENTSTSALFSRPDAPDMNPFVPAPEHEHGYGHQQNAAMDPQTHMQPESAVCTTHPLSPLPGSPATFILSSCFAREPSISSGSSSSAVSPSPSPSPSPAMVLSPAESLRAGTKRKAEGEHEVYGGAGRERDVFRGAGQYGVTSGGAVGGSAGVKSRERRKVKERGSAGGRARVKGREKLFACPTPGCTKSYLNPNGLKYHLDKGTCVLEADISSTGKAEAVDVYPVIRETVDAYPALPITGENAAITQDAGGEDTVPECVAPSEPTPAPTPAPTLTLTPASTSVTISCSTSLELGLQYPLSPVTVQPTPAPGSGPLAVSIPTPTATPIPPLAQPQFQTQQAQSQQPQPQTQQPQHQPQLPPTQPAPGSSTPTLYQPQPLIARQRSTPFLQAQAQATKLQQQVYRPRSQHQHQSQHQAQAQPQPQYQSRSPYQAQPQAQPQKRVQGQGQGRRHGQGQGQRQQYKQAQQQPQAGGYRAMYMPTQNQAQVQQRGYR